MFRLKFRILAVFRREVRVGASKMLCIYYNLYSMRIKLATKAVISIFIINIIFIIILVPLLYYFNNKFTKTVIDSNNETSIILRDNIQKSYRDMAMDNMKMLSSNTAYTVGEFLASHPKVTREELINNQMFQRMSAKSFYYTGYTLVVDPENFIVVSHPQKRFVGMHLYDIQNFSKTTYETIIHAIDLSKKQSGVPMIYDYAETSGNYLEKYAYITPVSSRTADGSMLAVIATVYVDDYSAKAGNVTKILFQKTNENISKIQSSSEWFVFAILSIVLLICIISIMLSMSVARRYTNKIISLSQSCKKIAEGDFTTKVQDINTSDELNDLATSIEYMRKNINKQDEITKIEIRKNEEKNKELGEALSIAEDKTKQLLGKK